ncbi:tyrosine-type recombinase/integrase [Mucilaginibacter ginsenosidivorax]|uniref:Site-specific integrase n=1 Tax=Mucilaginibacter ginsenosidivorax TaxID=862126 RepID=A0A5B8W4C5_9SPHI|nr:site-specific integrase [Mucilaginibacter ginsenosidivorax]QEC77815.1 site-specific integrase [Mucilaginibacter ginsenosidivorax]
METRKYTPPVIKKGKEVTSAPKGSSKAAEQAKQLWYIEYYYEGRQVRIKKGLNRLNHDHQKKQQEAEIILEMTKQRLANGYNPFAPTEYIEKRKKDFTTVAEAIIIFKDYHILHNSRAKTIGTYLSKLNALSSYFPGKLLKDVTTRDLEKFVQLKISDGTYSHNTVGAAKRIFSAFFSVMVKLDYITENPKDGFDKKIKSVKEIPKKHAPYSDTDLKRILTYLDEHDTYAAFFCRMVYYTCIRPGEIRGLRVKDVNLTTGKITVPASVKKNTHNNKHQTVDIDGNFWTALEKLNLSEYPGDYFLTGSTTNIVGKYKVGINTPYEKLMTALKKIDAQDMIDNPDMKETDRIINKGYDLYGFKHTSNIKRYLSGEWSLAQIMSANRHGSISMTENYLKDLGTFVETKHLKTQAI